MKLPEGNPKKESLASVIVRVATSLAVGIIGAMGVGILTSWQYAPLAAWDIAAIIFLVWLWLALRGRNAEETANLAKREDPGHAVSDIVLVLASVASLGAVLVVLFQASDSHGLEEAALTIFAIVSVIISWTVVHTVYMLRYARMFYKHKGGIEFNSSTPPCYSDFAYVAFTIGMTFQISDNNFTNTEFRRTSLKHALLSYLFGTIIVASVINIIAGLGK